MINNADPRLQRLLGDPALTAVRQRLRRRFEQAGAHATPTSIQLNNLEPAQYAALCQLTGRPSRTAQSMTINALELDTQLRAAGLASSLKDALQLLDGPIIAKANLRNALAAEWVAINASFESGTLLGAWLQNNPSSMQLLKRLGREPERARRLLIAANAVLGLLPAQGMARAQLAAEVLGDAHALDTGRPVATLVLAAWRHHERTNAGSEGEGTAGTGEMVEERAREVWSRAGVLVNELARPALFLNLPATVDSPCSWLPGEPGYLSLRQLLRQPCHGWLPVNLSSFAKTPTSSPSPQTIWEPEAPHWFAPTACLLQHNEFCWTN